MFDKLITRDTLKNLADPVIFQRGEQYFLAGWVRQLRDTGEKVIACVDGTKTYRVELWDDDSDLGFDCTCPHAADGNFCKHVVAVGLAWLSGQKELGGIASGKDQCRNPWSDIKNYLETQAPEVLVKLLLDTTERDERLYQSLLLKAELAFGGKADVIKAFRKAIDDATDYGFEDWPETADFSANLDPMVEELAELLTAENAEILVELAEYAIECLEESLQHIDDSDGEIVSIIETLSDLHLRACELAKLEPNALAERLFRLETELSLDFCSFDVLTYREVLGEQGLRRYRELAEIEWAKIKSGQSNGTYHAYSSCIMRIMESLARLSGNIEELVAIKSRNLSSAYHYMAIAEILSKDGQDDKALDWAERGLQAFPKAQDNQLRDFLVGAYLQRNRNDEALQLTWVQFEERACLEQYKKLHAVAVQCGVWPEQRERALARVAKVIADEAAVITHWKPKPSIPDYSLRIAIALWEDDLDAAWAAVNAGICNQDLQIVLAGKLESVRADDAIILYKRIVPLIIDLTNNNAYNSAIKLIRRIEAVMNIQEQNREFGDYLAKLRVRFKPKRNFIKLLDEVIGSTQKSKS
jgi:uncharacterized Zn finger protein